jgi:phenylacetate-CoA ligase
MSIEDAIHPVLARYMRAPQVVRSAVGSLYRALPARFKYGAAHARFMRDVQQGFDGVTAEQVEQRLAETIATACLKVPAYARWAALAHDRRPAFERLRELPLTGKLDIKRALDQHIAVDASPRQRLATFTGGSTAHPMHFYLERATSRPRETAYVDWIDRHLLGRRRDDWVLSLRGRSVAGAQRPAGEWTVREPIKRHLIVSSDHLEARFMPRYIDALKAHRPRVIHAFPSALYPLARWLDAHPCPEFTDGVRGILLTSETIYGFQQALFRRVFGHAGIGHYGHSERVLMGCTDDEGGSYRFWPLYGYLELVDRDGRVIDRPGVAGEIVGTGFDNRVMPFVRYRTGDVGVWADVPRPGRAARLQRIDGRLQEFVVCHDQRLVSITTLGAAHFSELAAAQRIQFVQRVPGRLTLRVVCPRPLRPAEADAVARAVRVKTQGGCEVEVEQVEAVEFTPRGKQQLLIQHLNLSAYFGDSRVDTQAPTDAPLPA